MKDTIKADIICYKCGEPCTKGDCMIDWPYPYDAEQDLNTVPKWHNKCYQPPHERAEIEKSANDLVDCEYEAIYESLSDFAQRIYEKGKEDAANVIPDELDTEQDSEFEKAHAIGWNNCINVMRKALSPPNHTER